MTDKKSPNIRINKVYTRTGDAGKTRLIGGEKRWKDDARVEAYGTVDELNAAIGLCRELVKETGNKNLIHKGFRIDPFWGVKGDNDEGENQHGKILMKIREIL